MDGLNIFQFWHDDSLPDDVAPMVNSWAALNPDAHYRRFNEANAAELIEREYGPRVLAAYRACRLPAMRSDIFRFCALHAEGGLYVDVGFTCIKPAKEFLPDRGRGLLLLRPKPLPTATTRWNIPTGFMFFRHRHDPLLETVLQQIVSNIEQRSGNNAWRVTGPAAITDLYTRVCNNTGPNVFEGIKILEWDAVYELMVMERPAYKSAPDHWLAVRDSGRSIFC
jgi:mannosyltransferase OCH1-like enzyme